MHRVLCTFCMIVFVCDVLNARACSALRPTLAGEGRDATPTFLAGCALALCGFTLYSHSQISQLRSRAQPVVAAVLEGGAAGGGRRHPAQQGPKAHDGRPPLLVPIQLTR